LPLKDTDDHGRLVCMGCARGWDHERHESHERYASSTINLKASPTWWILLKIPSVTDVNRFGILWETSRSRTFSKVHDIRTFSQTVGAARPSGQPDRRGTEPEHFIKWPQRIWTRRRSSN
jgi:hypothetical protein